MRPPPFILGLTGSIGTGKTTTAGMFAEAGALVWSADEAVNRLYGPGGGGEEAVRRICPEAVPKPGFGVDKDKLKLCLKQDTGLLSRLEAAIHPLVARDRNEFVRAAELDGADLVVAEIPLLYETGGETGVDAVVVVTAPENTQRHRVLSRGTMTETEFEGLLQRQMPNGEKMRRADFVIESRSLDEARFAVGDIIRKIKEAAWQRK